jgi:hypothetical protein
MGEADVPDDPSEGIDPSDIEELERLYREILGQALAGTAEARGEAYGARVIMIEAALDVNVHITADASVIPAGAETAVIPAGVDARRLPAHG